MILIYFDVFPNSVSTLWGSYGSSKGWCPLRCPSATAPFDYLPPLSLSFVQLLPHACLLCPFGTPPCPFLPLTLKVSELGVLVGETEHGRDEVQDGGGVD